MDEHAFALLRDHPGIRAREEASDILCQPCSERPIRIERMAWLGGTGRTDAFLSCHVVAEVARSPDRFWQGTLPALASGTWRGSLPRRRGYLWTSITDRKSTRLNSSHLVISYA